MEKKNIAVVMGGHSDEGLVSLKSGQLIYDSLDRNLYNVYKIVILRDEWFFLDQDERRYPINKENFSVTLENKQLKFDVCFNIIHGMPGENGIMQAYWDAIGQKYTGCDSYQSALTFNKKDTLAVLSQYGIHSAKSVYFRAEDIVDVDAIVERLGLPVIVKPNQSGSSLGVSKVEKKSELLVAMKKAFEKGNDILIQSFLSGTEISVGVISFKGEIIVLGITEIVHKNEFFDYQAKYEGASEEVTPARIDEETTKRVVEAAKLAYKALGMKGFSRSEYILIDGNPHMLEMNTTPAFSPTSVFPQQVKHYGISIKDLCDAEIKNALNRHVN